MKRAFTLLELLISCAILVVILGTISSVTWRANSLRQLTARRTTLMTEGRALLDALEHDISQVVGDNIRVSAGGADYLKFSSPRLACTNNILQLVRTRDAIDDDDADALPLEFVEYKFSAGTNTFFRTASKRVASETSATFETSSAPDDAREEYSIPTLVTNAVPKSGERMIYSAQAGDTITIPVTSASAAQLGTRRTELAADFEIVSTESPLTNKLSVFVTATNSFDVTILNTIWRLEGAVFADLLWHANAADKQRGFEAIVANIATNNAADFFQATNFFFFATNSIAMTNTLEVGGSPLCSQSISQPRAESLADSFSWQNSTNSVGFSKYRTGPAFHEALALFSWPTNFPSATTQKSKDENLSPYEALTKNQASLVASVVGKVGGKSEGDEDEENLPSPIPLAQLFMVQRVTTGAGDKWTDFSQTLDFVGGTIVSGRIERVLATAAENIIDAEKRSIRQEFRVTTLVELAADFFLPTDVDGKNWYPVTTNRVYLPARQITYGDLGANYYESDDVDVILPEAIEDSTLSALSLWLEERDYTRGDNGGWKKAPPEARMRASDDAWGTAADLPSEETRPDYATDSLVDVCFAIKRLEAAENFEELRFIDYEENDETPPTFVDVTIRLLDPRVRRRAENLSGEALDKLLEENLLILTRRIPLRIKNRWAPNE